MKRRLGPPCGVVKFARVLTIWRLLRASLRMTPCLTARRLLHRPVARPGPAETRFAQTVRALLSGRVANARRGTRGNENHKVKKRFQDAFQSAFKTHDSIERIHQRFTVIKNDFEGQHIPRMGDAAKLNMDVFSFACSIVNIPLCDDDLNEEENHVPG
ncbi:MAG: hypothetical protein HF981_13220 [Desulfobacteraceae bacterium]|nr:hypothetical protein [Desulfobacteraceae bacterium]MBC2751342.1 hypothetical protein [Desulfobacteraceae bacterium]